MALAAAQVAAPAPPTTPATVAEFLAQADAMVERGGESAAQSPEADAIRTAIQEAAMAYRASLALAAQRGEKPSSCPPPPGQAQLSLADIMGYFRAFPLPNRAMPLATAFALVMTLRFPCNAQGR